MQISVDDRPYTPAGRPGQTIADLAAEINNARGNDRERLVVSIRCDGREITGEELTAILETPADQFEHLELQTQPLTPLVRSTLTQSIDLLEESVNTRHLIADLLADGRVDEAMRRMQQFFEGWRQIQESMLVSAQALRADLDAIQVNRLSLLDIFSSIKDHLNELKTALESRDFVVVADVIRYEFDEPFEHWRAFLNHLRDLLGKER